MYGMSALMTVHYSTVTAVSQYAVYAVVAAAYKQQRWMSPDTTTRISTNLDLTPTKFHTNIFRVA